MESLVFTPAAVVDLLSKIDELGGYDIDYYETASGISFTIGDSSYTISSNDAEPILVDSEVVDVVENINNETYSEFDESQLESIQSGVFRELAKSLLVGGMVRLTTKLLGGKS